MGYGSKPGKQISSPVLNLVTDNIYVGIMTAFLLSFLFAVCSYTLLYK